MDDDTIEKIIELALGRYTSTRDIDWEDLLGRVEVQLGIDLPESYLDPKIRQIQKAVRKAIKEANE